MKKLSDYKNALKLKGLSDEQINELIVTIATLVHEVLLAKITELSKEDLEDLDNADKQEKQLGKEEIAALFEKRFNISIDKFMYTVSSRLFEDVLQVYEKFEVLVDKLKNSKDETRDEFIKLISQDRFEEANRLLKNY